MTQFMLYLRLLLVYAIEIMFLNAYAIAVLQLEGKRSRREREAVSNAAWLILARIGSHRYVL